MGIDHCAIISNIPTSGLLLVESHWWSSWDGWTVNSCTDVLGLGWLTSNNHNHLPLGEIWLQPLECFIRASWSHSWSNTILVLCLVTLISPLASALWSMLWWGQVVQVKPKLGFREQVIGEEVTGGSILQDYFRSTSWSCKFHYQGLCTSTASSPVHISNDQYWARHIDATTQKAHQHLAQRLRDSACYWII